MRHWLTDKTRADFAEIFDCAPNEVDARLDAQAAQHRPEPLTVATVMGAVCLADELARRAVEGEQVEEHHPIERNAA